MMEEHLRGTLLRSHGDPMIFLKRPISATMLVMAAIAIIVVLLPAISKTRAEALREPDTK